MLFLCTSNQLENLSGLFSKVTSTPLKDTFSKELVVVQNAGMARWLSMQQADFTGISANTEYLFPAEFMWKLLRMVSSGISEQSQCTPETLQYHLMEELSTNSENYPELQHYIRDKHSQKIDEVSTWTLSVELAQIFDQYLFFRSDWIEEWESESVNSDKQLDWQGRLWLRCVKDKQLIHWLHLQKQFKESITSIDQVDLPERVSFFSMSALSPGYLDLLGELSKRTDVYLFMMNPCEDIYWGDILSQKKQSKLLAETQQYVEVGNPLLASMGIQGRDFIHQLIDLGESEHIKDDWSGESSQKPNPNSILHRLQQDVFQLNQPQPIEDYQAESDNSIQINACHTVMREVEVLYDQILDALDSDSTLAPSDIVVMHPDIENYAPYIEAVFSTRQHSTSQNSKVRLPYSIADRNPLNTLQLIEALLKTLSLSDTRFDVESVFEILEYEDVYSNFGFDDKQIKICRQLARATNIRWGISSEYREQNKLPKTQEHTWKYALDSLLLGYTMGESLSDNPLFESGNELPLFVHNEVEGNNALVLANFKRFTDVLFTITEWHDSYCLIDAWLEKIKTLIAQLFVDSSDTAQILNSINNIKQTTELTEFSQKISFNVFKKILEANLSNITGSEKFLGHGITFCSMVPMRSVPFKLIALMGMNDGEFPRHNKRHSFDRLSENPRRGDRSKRDEDRYLFLESVLAARSRLFISYIGQSVKDNTELPPSVLVSELLDTLADYSQIPSEEWITKHPLQAFSPRYFDNSSNLYSYNKEYTSIKRNASPPSQVFIEKDLVDTLNQTQETIKKELSLNELIHFYQSPSRAFLKNRFGIQTFDEVVNLPVREPFELEGFTDTEIRQLILASKNEEQQQTLARAKGLLPYGEIGENVFEQEKQIIQSFEESLPEIHYLDNQPFSINIKDYQLFGELTQITELGRSIQSLTKAYFPSFIDMWFNHLILNEISDKNKHISAIGRHSFFYSPEESFSFLPVKDAKEQLEFLVEYYLKGQNFPLKFFPKSAKALHEKSPENIRLAVTAWHGANQRAGEKDKFENWLLHRTLEFTDDKVPEEFLELSDLIFGNIYTHFEVI